MQNVPLTRPSLAPCLSVVRSLVNAASPLHAAATQFCTSYPAVTHVALSKGDTILALAQHSTVARPSHNPHRPGRWSTQPVLFATTCCSSCLHQPCAVQAVSSDAPNAQPVPAPYLLHCYLSDSNAAMQSGVLHSSILDSDDCCHQRVNKLYCSIDSSVLLRLRLPGLSLPRAPVDSLTTRCGF